MQSSTIIRDLPGYWLVLDASCPTTRVALFREGRLIREIDSPENAMQALLASVSRLISSEGVAVRDINGFIYCVGPGSILGIRLSVIAIKTWCSVHRVAPDYVLNYHSLAMAALTVPSETGNEFAMLSEWKKNHWNVLQAGPQGVRKTIEIWDNETVLGYPHPIYRLPQRKGWADHIDRAIPVDYRLELLESSENRLQVLSPMKDWEIYVPEEKDYVKWSGERHR